MSIIKMNNVIYLPKSGIFNQMLYHKPGNLEILSDSIVFRPSIMSGGMLSTAEELSFKINQITKITRTKERYMGIPGLKAIIFEIKGGGKYKFIATLTCGGDLHSIPDLIKDNH